MWETLFSLTNYLALAGWIVLVLLPRGALGMSAVLYFGVGVLCSTYTVILTLIFSGVADITPISGAQGFDVTQMSIANTRAIFMSDGGIVIGWTHYLAFDLFIGLWIAKDADAKGFSRITQVPFLIATFLAGPVGLLAWLIMRESRARIGARAQARS